MVVNNFKGRWMWLTNMQDPRATRNFDAKLLPLPLETSRKKSAQRTPEELREFVDVTADLQKMWPNRSPNSG